MSGSNEILLKNTELFKYLGLDELGLVADLFTEEEYAAGDSVISEGAPGDAMFLIRSGRVKVRKGGDPEPVEIVELGPGDLFGEMALIEDAPRSAGVECAEDTVLLCVTRRAFAGMFNDYPAVSLKILLSLCRVLCSRIRATDETVVALNRRIGQLGGLA